MNPTLKRSGWVALAVLLVLGLWRVRFDTEVLNLLPKDLPAVRGLLLYQKHFGNADELLVTVQSSEPEACESAARELALAMRAETNLVARALWQPPWLEHPEETVELLAMTWLNQPPDAFAELADRLAPDKLPALLAASREALATSMSPDEIARLGYDPLGLSRLPESAGQAPGFGQGGELFGSHDGTFRLVFLKPAAPLVSYRDCVAWLERFRQRVEEIRRAGRIPSGVKIGYTGAPAFIAETGGGMERDMRGSATGTLLVVAALFWWAHRRLWPLCWLTILLLVILAGTLALGGLIYGGLNVVSLGFAAILLGLTDDYPAILYQEALDHPELSATDIRRRCTSAIVWSAVTTAGAFLLLNFAALPGLAQLGTLVALGVLLAALVILYGFLPVALKQWRGSKPTAHACVPPTASARKSCPVSKFAVSVTIALPLVAIVLLWLRPPVVDQSAEAMRPTDSPAYTTMQDVSTHLVGKREPLWVLVPGRDEGEVARRMAALAAQMQQPEARRCLGNVTFPSALWPRPEWQQTNLIVAAGLRSRIEELREAVLAAGYSDEGFALTRKVFESWQRAGKATGAIWPTNIASRWLLEKVAARTDRGWLALGIAQPNTNNAAAYREAMAMLGEPLAANEAHLSGWSALGEALYSHTLHRLPWLAAVMILVVALCLWLAFRTVREVLLSFATLAAGFIGLLTLMSLFGWSWNLMNLMAVPLLLGASVDYTIHTQLVLRRSGGDVSQFRRTTGRALLLAGATTIAGFGSLAWSGNAGLASLGLICGVGIACSLIASVGLLPVWWVWVAGNAGKGTSPKELSPTIGPGEKPAPADAYGATPSSFYRVGLWQFGMAVVRLLPTWLVKGFFLALAELHFRMRSERREVVVRNLLPPLAGDRTAAERTVHRLYRRFAVKLAELWKMESGVSVRQWLTAPEELEVIRAACARGCGVLFVTLHLGNWEHGGLLLNELGIKLTVLTLAEPDDSLTRLRVASRARWGIQTILIGESDFAFVEVIKQLQAGANMALSLDRPPKKSAAEIELFGRPFGASSAAAELARASGCALIGVTIVRHPEGFAVKVLPEFMYDRQALGNREARRQLTQQILRAFEPQIQQYLDQWYQFVPIWPNGK